MKITEYWIQGEQRPTLTMMSGEWLPAVDLAIAADNYKGLNKGPLAYVSTQLLTPDRNKFVLRRV